MTSTNHSPRIFLLALLLALNAAPAVAQVGNLIITTPDLPNGTVGQSYSATIQTTGGVPPISFSIIGGSLPAGINMSSSGVISGTPATGGFHTFTVRAVDSPTATTPQTTSKTFSLYVHSVITVSPAALPNAVVNELFNTQLSASGGSSPYFFEFEFQEAQPYSWLNLTSTGALSGTPPSTGNFPFSVRVWDQSGSYALQSYTLIVQPPPVDFTPTALPTATVNTPYSATFTPTGVATGYVFSAPSGGLPQGLTLSSMGTVAGTPTAAGSYSFAVRLVYGNLTVEKIVTLSVEIPPLSIDLPTMPEGVTGQPYSASFTAKGGVPPYSFSVTGGALPPGLSLSSSGTLAGSPTANGTSQFSVTVTDSGNHQASSLFTIVVFDPLALGPADLPRASLSAPYSVQLYASGGAPPYSFSISGSLLPGISFSGGLFSGLPTAPGVYPVTVTLTDSGLRQLVRDYKLVLPSNIRITTPSPLSQSTVGQTFSATFTAAEGIPGYQWTSVGGLPPGLSLDPVTGVLSGQPSKAGTFTFGVTVIDSSEGTDTKTFSATFVLPSLPGVSYTQIGSSAGPAQQPAFGIQLSQTYPVTLTGLVKLSFMPDRYGDDPAVLFSNGSRTIPFTVPAGQQRADFGSILAALQTGTVAGTITLEASLAVEQQDVTPSPAPRHAIRIAALAPVISRLEINRTSNGFELIVTGYSTSRQITHAVIKLTPISGSTIATSEFTLPLESAFTSYYGGSASAPYGSQFRLVIPFFVPQGLSGLGSASVTLTNQVGSSTASSVNF